MKDYKKRLFEMVDRLSEDISQPASDENTINLAELDAVDLSNMLGTKVQSVEDPSELTNLDTVEDVEEWYNEFINKYGNEGQVVLDTDNGYIWNVVGNENYVSLNETIDDSEMSFEYKNGNFIPKGYEDKGIAYREVRQPMDSENKKYIIVKINPNGTIEQKLETTDSFDDLKNIISNYL